MKAKPLYRSLTFLLGLPGLLFILWTWHDSLTHQAGIFRPVWLESPDKVTGVDDTISYRSAGFWATLHVFEPGPHDTVRHSPATMSREELFPELRAQRASPRLDWKTPDTIFNHPGIYVRQIVIPHWLALILYGAAWGAVICWRQLRIRRWERSTLTDP
jgi:hypothetical protein